MSVARFPQGPLLDDAGSLSLEWFLWLQNPEFASTIITTALDVASGGTGLNSGTSGGILGFTGTTTIASSALLTNHALVIGGGAGSTPSTPVGLGTATTVLHGNASGNPSYSAVSLVGDVTGNLATSHLNGGTGATSATFWRGDGTWSTPTGTGVSSIGVTSPITTTGGTTPSIGMVNQGTATTVLHGNASGNPSFSAVALGTDVSGTLLAAQFPALTGDITTSAGSLATTLASVVSASTNTKITYNAKGLVTAGTAAVLASADYANQGTASTVLHGNAAGNPSFGAVSLTADVSGILPVANGGTGAATLKLPVYLFAHFADQGNGTTVETDLYSDTIAAGQLTTNGDKLEIEYGGTFVSSATATRELKIYFGGSVIFDTGLLTVSLAAAWTAYATIIRVSASIIRYMISLTTEGAALAAYTAVGEVTGLTLSNTNVLKITGQAAGVGAASNDLVAKLGSIIYRPF